MLFCSFEKIIKVQLIISAVDRQRYKETITVILSQLKFACFRVNLKKKKKNERVGSYGK